MKLGEVSTIDVSKATLQEAMDYAVRRIVEQGGRCGSSNGMGGLYCMYGDGEGKHCAVGWLLPETDRELMAREEGIRSLVIRYSDRVPAVVRDNVEAMAKLQRFHDAESRMRRGELVCELAVNHNIDITGPHWKAWVSMGELP